MKVLTRFVAAAAVLMLSVVFSGCGQKAKTQKDPVVESYRLIDENRTDEAIELLESELKANPTKDQKLKMKLALASAFAHKAGVRVNKLVNMVKKLEPVSKIELKRDPLEPSASANEKIDQQILGITQMIKAFSGVLDFYAAIPNLQQSSDVSFVKNAVSILEDIEDIKPEDALYRAILRIIVFKHSIADLIGQSSPLQMNDCKPDLLDLSARLSNAGYIFIELLSDLAIASPKQADALNSKASEIGSFVSDFSIFAATTTALDEVSTALAKNSIFEMMGLKWQCSTN